MAQILVPHPHAALHAVTWQAAAAAAAVPFVAALPAEIVSSAAAAAAVAAAAADVLVVSADAVLAGAAESAAACACPSWADDKASAPYWTGAGPGSVALYRQAASNSALASLMPRKLLSCGGGALHSLADCLLAMAALALASHRFPQVDHIVAGAAVAAAWVTAVGALMVCAAC